MAVPPRGVFAGLATLDIVYRLEGVPKPNSKNVVRDQAIHAGGPAANAAVTFAALGGTPTLVTAIGRHRLASLVKEDLARWRVDAFDLIPDWTGLPSLASVMVSSPGGDRLAASTAALRLPEPPSDFELGGEGIDIVLVDGHLPAVCLEAARQARDAGIPVVADAGSWKEGFDALLELCGAVICSEDFLPPGCENPRDILRFLEDLGVPRRAVTRGGKPVLWSERPGTFDELPVEPVDAVDTLGAGDIFHGAFCYAAAAASRPFHESLEFASRVATHSCRSFGTREWIGSPGLPKLGE